MARTTISINEKIFEQLLQLAGTENKTEAVNKAITSLELFRNRPTKLLS